MRAPLWLAALLLAGGCNENRPLPADLGGSAKELGPSDLRGDRTAADRAADRMLPDTRPRPPAKWEKAASMTAPRRNHTATLLLDGTVLVVGGRDWEGVDSAERYDPKTDTWSAAGKLATAHWGHEAVLLKDGRVLVVGGCKGAESYDCMVQVGSELYDPKTNAWQKVAQAFHERIAHAASLLNDGRVLVAGGTGAQSQVLGLEIYDAATNTWSSPVATLAVARQHLTATLLPTGKVLLAAGWDAAAPKFHPSLEVFDPTNGSLTTLASTLAEARAGHTATLLPDGRVLIVGGYCDPKGRISCTVKNAELYDSSSDKVSNAGSIGTNRYAHDAVLLADGRALVTGGVLHAKLAALFDGKLMSWSSAPPMAEERIEHASVRLGERVLVTGGASSAVTNASAEIFTP